MAIYTPRGIKIRLQTEEAFTYIARLQPKFSAFQVLKTVEGIQLIPSVFGFVTGLFLFFTDYSAVDIGLYVGLASILGILLKESGFYIIPFLVRIITGLSYLHGFGFFTISILLTGLLTVGWKGTMFYFIGRWIASLINSLVDILHTKRIFKKTGITVTASERNFFNSYRLHASRMGISTSLNVGEEEIASKSWELPLMKLGMEWPQVTARFTS